MEPSAYDEMRHLEDRHWWFRGRRIVAEPRVREALRDAPPGAVLDFGCGTGGTLAHFARLDVARRWIGVDPSARALALCSQRGLGVPLVQGGGPQLPLRDASVACVFAFDVIEHFTDDEALVRDLARVVVAGGQLVATVPAYPRLWSRHDVALHHARRYRAGELEWRLDEAGFEVERRHGFNFLLLSAIAVFRVLRSGRSTLAHTDFFELPRPLNAALASIFWVERGILAILPIPFGVSFVIRARKR